MKRIVYLLFFMAAATTAVGQNDWVVSPSGHRIRISCGEYNAFVTQQDSAITGHVVLPDSASYWEYFFEPDADWPYDSVLHTVPVTVVEDYAFAHCRSLTGITIPATVTHIGYGAFSYCTELDSMAVLSGNSAYATPQGCNAYIDTRENKLVCGCRRSTIPPTVTSIASRAFQGIEELAAIVLPDSLEVIGNYAFDGCTALRSFHIPAKVRSVGYMCLAHCRGLTSLTVDPDNAVFDSRGDCNAVIYTANKWLVAGCAATVIPDDVRRIDQKAFVGFDGLRQLTLPNSISEICDFAFQDCSGLTSIHIPASVLYIGHNPFAGCTSLDTITVDSANTKYDSRSSCNAIYDKNNGQIVSGCRSTVIPSNTYRIAPYAFYGIAGLHRIVLPKKVFSIGEEAFAGCTGVTTIISADEIAPQVSWGTFDGIDPDIAVHIRRGSLASYTERWSHFHNFIEDFPVGIDETTEGTLDYSLVCRDGILSINTVTPLPVRVYDISGRELYHCSPVTTATLRLTDLLSASHHILLVQVGNYPAEKIVY